MAEVETAHLALISVGSNMGDKLDNCLAGIAALTESGRSKVLKSSRFYRTSPVDYTDQAWFVNGVVMIETTLSPFDLLDEVQVIQRKMGRTKDTVRFGPRVLDLDILLYDDLVIHTDRLTIPHPRMHKRAFVLKPICDINSSVVHPVLDETVVRLLTRLDGDGQQVHPLRDQPAEIGGVSL